MLVLGFFLDFIFPKRCVNCNSFGSFLCQDCQAKIRSVEDGICPMCERVSFNGQTHPGCKTRYSPDGLISFFRYDGPIKQVIKRLKYKPYLTELATILLREGVCEGDTLNKVSPFKNFVVVPVPLHPQRERQRGFNQATLIGKAIAKKLELKFINGILRRTKNTKPQVELKGDERRENIKNAFSLGSNYILHSNPYVLLTDDVWTTGSTLRTCANVLKRAGVKKVWAMTLAR